MNTKEYAYNMGKDFTSEVEFDLYQTKEGHIASVSIGEEYYESDPYQSRYLALCEVKGFLEGVKARIEEVLQSIEREINEDN
jgi:hypothetical protein